ncbi:MAG: NAD(P)-dependent oxidoreductase [Micropruina sp.]|uniref:2-hydroxyacid dehydrogenase n=1 Tax=Micropruina sp. TaxID=2737536 RepID=UPI0039E6DB6A
MAGTFRVGVSRDFLEGDRNVWGDIGLARLDRPDVTWEYLPEDVAAFLPEHLAPYDGVLFAAPAVTAASFADGVPRPLVLSRFGVGYDTVDLAACTGNAVAVTITPDGARKPVATATLAMLLAVLHNLVAKDALVRQHRWSDRTGLMGTGLNGLTIGLFGVGNTGGEFLRLLAPFDVTLIGHDPFCSPERAAALGVRLVDRAELAAASDAVIIMAALTPQTRHAVDAHFLDLMKPSSVLINMARGPIVDEAALIDALGSGSIRAAGLDVFEDEPQSSGIEKLPNVTLAPHSLSWTSEMSLGNGNSCVDALLAVAAGQAPRFVVNRDVLDSPEFRARLEEWA